MPEFTIRLDSAAAMLYQQVAEAAGRPVETVLADALFQLAGELSLEAIQKGASRILLHQEKVGETFNDIE